MWKPYFRWRTMLFVYLLFQFGILTLWSLDPHMFYLQNASYYFSSIMTETNSNRQNDGINANTVKQFHNVLDELSPSALKEKPHRIQADKNSVLRHSQERMSTQNTNEKEGEDLDSETYTKNRAFWGNNETIADIAVCVSGQVARWQPFHLLDHFLHVNKQYRFHFFFNIQSSPPPANDSSSSSTATKAHHSPSGDNKAPLQQHNIVYNTDLLNVFDPSYMTFLSFDETWTFLQSLLSNEHATVSSLRYARPYTDTEWKEYFQTQTLDRITQFIEAQGTILNMYAHQPKCIEQILQYEQAQNDPQQEFNYHYFMTHSPNDDNINENVDASSSKRQLSKKRVQGKKGKQSTASSKKPTVSEENSKNIKPFRFDYIASTREDVYFFKPFNLSSIIAHMRQGQDARQYLSPTATPEHMKEFPYLEQCDIPFKRCLNFWGFNMRFFILTRDKAIPFFGNRLSFYSFLLTINKTVENPERFELAMANALQLTPCPLSVNDFPVTAARYFMGGRFCFIHFEIQHCVPDDSHAFVQSHLCSEFRRNMYLQYLYTDAKVRLKHNFTIANYQPLLSATLHQRNNHKVNDHVNINNRNKRQNSNFQPSLSTAGGDAQSIHIPLLPPGMNLTEQYKSLKGVDLRRNYLVNMPFHSFNATYNIDIVKRIPRLGAMTLTKDIVFMERTWQPLYAFPSQTNGDIVNVTNSNVDLSTTKNLKL